MNQHTLSQQLVRVPQSADPLRSGSWGSLGPWLARSTAVLDQRALAFVPSENGASGPPLVTAVTSGGYRRLPANLRCNLPNGSKRLNFVD